MKLMERVHYFSLLLLCAFSVSCSVHQSSGRKQFENQAPGNLTNSQIGVRVQTDECWTQPANEPLWFTEKNTQYTLQFNEQDQLEICIYNSSI